MKLEDDASFFEWAAEHWPAPRWSVELDPGQLAPWLRLSVAGAAAALPLIAATAAATPESGRRLLHAWSSHGRVVAALHRLGKRLRRVTRRLSAVAGVVRSTQLEDWRANVLVVAAVLPTARKQVLGPSLSERATADDAASLEIRDKRDAGVGRTDTCVRVGAAIAAGGGGVAACGRGAAAAQGLALVRIVAASRDGRSVVETAAAAPREKSGQGASDAWLHQGRSGRLRVSAARRALRQSA